MSHKPTPAMVYKTPSCVIMVLTIELPVHAIRQTNLAYRSGRGTTGRHCHDVLLGLLPLVLVLRELRLGVKRGAVAAELLDDLRPRLWGV